MRLIDTVRTVLTKHLLKTFKTSALLATFVAGTPFVSALPFLAPLASMEQQSTATGPVLAPPASMGQKSKAARPDPDSWIVVLKGQPLISQHGERPLSQKSASHLPSLSDQKQELQQIRDRFLAEAGLSGTVSKGSAAGKGAAPAVQALDTFENLIHGVVLEGDRADAARWAKQDMVQGVYPNRRLQLQPLDLGEAAANPAPTAAHGYGGEGQVIAVIDTGVDYTHPDLGGGFGPGYKVIGGYDFVDNDPDPMDGHFHGTHVAGIAAADGQMKGMAPKAKILAYRVLNSNGEGSDAELIAALEAALDPDGDPNTDDGADVINLSLGGPGHADDPASQAVDRAVAAGVVVVTAAGNNGHLTWQIGSPGASREAITVGAMDTRGYLAWFSSSGPAEPDVLKPDLLALGEIESTIPGGGYIVMPGTSMAAPAVAGAAALLRQAHPDWQPAQVKAVLQTSADPLTGYPAHQQGAGALNIERALQATVAADSAHLDFGRLDHSEPSLNLTRTVRFTNQGQEAVTIAIPSLPETDGLAITVSPNEQQVNPGAVAEFTIGLTVDNAVWPYRREQAWFDARALTVRVGDQEQQLRLSAAKFVTFQVENTQPEAELHYYALVNEAGVTLNTDALFEGKKERLEPGQIELLASALGNDEAGRQTLFFQLFKEDIRQNTTFHFDPRACTIPFEQHIIDLEGRLQKVDETNRIHGKYAWFNPNRTWQQHESYSHFENLQVLFSDWPIRHDILLMEAVDLGGNRITILPTATSALQDGAMPVYDLREMATVDLDVDMGYSEDSFNGSDLRAHIVTDQGNFLLSTTIHRLSGFDFMTANDNRAKGRQPLTMFMPTPNQTYFPQSTPEPIKHLAFNFEADQPTIDIQATTHLSPYLIARDDQSLVKARFTRYWANEATETEMPNAYRLHGEPLFPNWGMYLTNQGRAFLYEERQQEGTYKTPTGGHIHMAHRFVFEKDGVVLGSSDEGFQLLNPEPGRYKVTATGLAHTYALGKDHTVTLETVVGEDGPQPATAPALQKLTWDGDRGTLYFFDREATKNYQDYLTDTPPTGFEPKPITVEAAVRPVGGGPWTSLPVTPKTGQPGVFTFTAPPRDLGEAQNLRIRATDPSGDRITYESPAYFRPESAGILPTTIDTSRHFSLLTVSNHAETTQEARLTAFNRDGKEQHHTLRLRAGAAKTLFPASLFPKMQDYQLRLTANSDQVTMVLEEGLTHGFTPQTGINHNQLSRASSLVGIPYDAAGTVEVASVFPAGIPARETSVTVELWDSQGKQGETTLTLPDARMTTSSLGDLFPDYQGTGTVSLQLTDTFGHHLIAGYRRGSTWIQGEADRAGWDNRLFYVVPTQAKSGASDLVLVNRQFTQPKLQLSARTLEGGDVWEHQFDLAPGMTTLSLATLIPFETAYHLEIRNIHSQVHSALLVGDKAVRMPTIEGFELGSNLTFNHFSVFNDTRLVVTAPDSTVDTEVVVGMRNFFGQPTEKVFTIKAGEPRIIGTLDLLRLGISGLDSIQLTLRSPQNAKLSAYGVQRDLFGQIRVIKAERR